VNPRAASGGGVWEDAPPLFLRFQKDFLAIPRVFRGCFVIFKLFNVIFLFSFEFFIICNVDVKKKIKRKKI
jgi:hypothetical protein